MNKLRKLSRQALLYILLAFFSFSLSAQTPVYTNSFGMEFTLIKPGSFIMGRFQPPYPKPDSTNKNAQHTYTPAQFKLAEKLAIESAMPGFTATIKEPFYIGRFEVTQEQWQKVMGYNPSAFQGDKVSDDRAQHPVENVNWKDAQRFVQKLNALEKGKVYRLPTEVEWEYAARAGAEDDIPWKQIRATAQIGTRTTNKVGGKQPNAWGLYDMLGNVWEWVQDYYNEKIFANPVTLKSGKEHVLKGASFVGDVKNATYMTHAAGPGNKWDVGLRVVIEVNE